MREMTATKGKKKGAGIFLYEIIFMIVTCPSLHSSNIIDTTFINSTAVLTIDLFKINPVPLRHYRDLWGPGISPAYQLQHTPETKFTPNPLHL